MIEDRKQIYEEAIAQFGIENQVIVCIEELSELQKELTKFLRGNAKTSSLADEVADVIITVEQMILYFDLENEVKDYMDAKLKRLEERL